MAMRMFTKDEWLKELGHWRLTQTKERTATAEIWLTPKGRPISIPLLDEYPDSLLPTLQQQLSALGENPFEQPAQASTSASPPQ